MTTVMLLLAVFALCGVVGRLTAMPAARRVPVATRFEQARRIAAGDWPADERPPAAALRR
jgi:hypothetical protein